MNDDPRQIVTVTQFRDHLAQHIDRVRYGDEWLCIKRKHCDPVYLVSQADFDLINDRRDALLGAPKNPKTGTVTTKGFWTLLREALRADRG